MHELTIFQKNLPENLEDLTKFALIGRDKLTAVKAELSAIKKLNLAKEVRQQKLNEAQFIAEIVTQAEVKIGELLLSIPKATPNNNPHHVIDSAVDYVKPKSDVIKELGFSQKQAERLQKIAANPEIVAKAITEAKENDDILSRSFILEKIKLKEREESRKTIKIVAPKPINGRYDVIYADPPWQYDFCSTENRAIENNYPTMELQDIKNLKFTTEYNAVLFLWATAPKLVEALDVMSAWGFTYKSQMVWDKEIIGTGYWARGQHEILLIGTKGNFSPPLPADRVSSIFKERRTNHSKKPDYYYNLIEQMFPNCKYLELFARQKYNEKWETWGNCDLK